MFFVMVSRKENPVKFQFLKCFLWSTPQVSLCGGGDSVRKPGRGPVPYTANSAGVILSETKWSRRIFPVAVMGYAEDSSTTPQAAVRNDAAIAFWERERTISSILQLQFQEIVVLYL